MIEKHAALLVGAERDEAKVAVATVSPVRDAGRPLGEGDWGWVPVCRSLGKFVRGSGLD